MVGVARRSLVLGLFFCHQRFDIDTNLQGMAAATDNDAADGADVIVVSGPAEGDVAGGGDDAIRWVEVDPAEIGKKTEIQA